MSDLWFNIRFGKRHFQLSNRWRVSFQPNQYWYDNPDIYAQEGKFAIYCLFGKQF